MILALAAVAVPILSQQLSPAKPSFEVAIVKPSTSADNRIMIMAQPGGRFMVNNATLKMVMGVAYRVRDFQMMGGPNWISSDRWNIEAKAEEGTVPPQKGFPDPTVPDPLMLMVQSLIEDRFQLKMHRETKELAVYELLVGKSGSKMKLSADQSPIEPPGRGAPPPPPQRGGRGGPTPRGSVAVGRGNLDASGVPLRNFVQILAQQLGRPVIDKTDLKGLYDIKLQWTPELGQGQFTPGGAEPPPPPADASGPSIFTAVQEQLGLRLESAKGQVEVLVIDSVQKPTEN